MSAKKITSYIGDTYESTDPRDDGRRIRIVDADEEAGRLRYRRLEPSTVSPKILVPLGRKGTLTPETLKKGYRKV